MLVMLSAGRAGLVKTLDWCKPDLIAVKKEESKAYAKAYPALKQLVVPNNINTAGKVRQYAIDTLCCDHVQIDDDLSYRSLCPTYGNPVVLLCRIFKALKQYSLTSIGRQYMGGMRAKIKWEWEDVAGNEILGINYKDMKDSDISKFTTYEDTALSMHAMSKRGTMVSYRGLVNNANLQVGGCSTSRSVKTILQGQELILARWPQYAKPVDKPNTKVSNMEGVGRGLRISWAKIARDRKGL